MGYLSTVEFHLSEPIGTKYHSDNWMDIQITELRINGVILHH